MQDLINQIIKKQLTAQLHKKMAENLGTSSQKESQLTAKATNIIINNLAKNAESPEGAAALFKALNSQKHDGRVLENFEKILAAPESSEGPKILQHILQTTREEVAEEIATETETDSQTSTKTLTVMAPLVMGLLGKLVRSEKFNINQMTELLQIARSDKSLTAKGNRLATQFLDRNRDGNYKDDIFNTVKGWLGNKFNKK